ncbi:MAG TPA: hypothetical protein EYO73_07610, partial [Sulfurimonas sp.]|nr:hypothetical protein [Sulfurimonas sp.]
MADKKNSAIEEKKLTQYINDQQITNLIHFTPVANLESILQFGLIPRSLLEKKAIRIYMKPRFPGVHGPAGLRGAICLSISNSDHEVFSNICKNNPENLAVLIFCMEPILK